jgi:hypothetical protein
VGEESECLTAEEVVSFLRKPLSTVYKLTQVQILPAFTVGKHWRYQKQFIRDRLTKKNNAAIYPPITNQEI